MAQFGPSAPPGSGVKTEAGYLNHLVLYPVAIFRTDCDNRIGGLLAAERGFVRSGSQASLAVGGWYWTRGDLDVYEFHGKAYFAEHFGVQAGVLGTTHASGNDFVDQHIGAQVLVMVPVYVGGKRSVQLHKLLDLGVIHRLKGTA